MTKAIVNKTGLEPMGHALLCEPYDPEARRSGIIIPGQGSKLREMRAVVIEVGPDAWTGDYHMSKRCEAGDKVLISKFAGVMVTSPVDKKLYRLCNDEDVFCKITAESWEEVSVSDPSTQDRADQKALADAVRQKASGVGR